jgi:hypothetical protein
MHNDKHCLLARQHLEGKTGVAFIEGWRELQSALSAGVSNEGYPGIAHDLETMRAALTELVELKDMKERWHYPSGWDNDDAERQYNERQPKAWRVARAALRGLLTPEPSPQNAVGYIGPDGRGVANGANACTPSHVAPTHHEQEVQKHFEWLVERYSGKEYRYNTSSRETNYRNDAINLAKGVKSLLASASSSTRALEDFIEELSAYAEKGDCDACRGAGCVGIPGAQCRYCDGSGKNRLALAFKWLALEKRVNVAEEIAQRQMNDAEAARLELAELRSRTLSASGAKP